MTVPILGVKRRRRCGFSVKLSPGLSRLTAVCVSLCLCLGWLFLNFGDYEQLEQIICEGSKSRDLPQHRRLILLSYLDSGSDVIGEYIRISTQVFYLNQQSLFMDHDDDEESSSGYQFLPKFRGHRHSSKAMDFTPDLLNCNITPGLMTFLQSGSTFTKMDSCKCTPFGFVQVETCAQAARVRCGMATTIFVTSLHLKMRTAGMLLPCFPDLHIIHVVRDPRVVAVSRIKAGHRWNPDTFCQRLNKDAFISSELHNKYPGRIITLRFEDFVTAPSNVARILFQFAGINWTTIMSTGFTETLSNETAISQYEREKILINSTQANQWRREIDINAIRATQEKCFESMILFGYHIFNEENELNNFSIPSTKDTYSFIFNKAIAPL